MIGTLDGAGPGAAPAPDWWRTAVTYQVYLPSFADANGDGIGDLEGLRSRLPYLAGLGVDAIWITPWYPSPMADGGYDIADYRDIDPRFGTLADADRLVASAHALGLRVLVDIVPNHTSSEHPWFRAALANPDGSPERARYIFRAGRGDDGSEPPNNWPSAFGGPAWTRVPSDGRHGSWYLHLFASEQPDLDWSNPAVRAEFEHTLRFWFERGLDGLRIDVAMSLVKDPALPDLGDDAVVRSGASTWATPSHPYIDREGVHDLWRSWRAIADAYEPPRVFVGEVALVAPDRLARYVRRDELHTVFNFDFLKSPWNTSALRAAIDTTSGAFSAVGAPATWVLANHDEPRLVTRYGWPDTGWRDPALPLQGAPDLVTGRRRARAAALLLLALPGGAYIYQGEELGLPHVLDLPDEVLRDPTWERSGHTVRGRDGCRVPIPWTGQAPPFGFGPAGSHPWLPQPADWARFTVGAEERDPLSTLSLYRRALAIRRTHPGLAGGGFRWVEDRDDVLHFERERGLRCLVNLRSEPWPIPSGAAVLVRSDGPNGGPLPRDAAAWYQA